MEKQKLTLVPKRPKKNMKTLVLEVNSVTKTLNALSNGELTELIVEVHDKATGLRSLRDAIDAFERTLRQVVATRVSDLSEPLRQYNIKIYNRKGRRTWNQEYNEEIIQHLMPIFGDRAYRKVPIPISELSEEKQESLVREKPEWFSVGEPTIVIASPSSKIDGWTRPKNKLQ